MTTNVWYVYGFRKNRYDNLRILDEDKRDLSKHQTVWNIPGLQDQVTACVQKKTIDVNLTEATWKTYMDGNFTTEFDETEQELQRTQPTEDLGATIRDFMRASQETNHEMVRELVASMKQVLGRKDTQRMNINKFDGSNEDPRAWMTMFERAAEANNWLNDELKINNLKSCLVLNSAADRWFSSRIIDETEQDQEWEDWKLAFFGAFAQNRVQTAHRALKWEYRNGSIMDFFYEKERLLKIAFPDMGMETFISLVIYGLPADLQAVAMTIDPRDKQGLVECLQRLPTKNKQLRHETSRDFHRDTGDEKSLTKTDKHHNYNTRKSNYKKEEVAKTTAKPGKANNVQDIKEPQVAAAVTDHNGIDVIAMKCNGVNLQVMLDTGATIDLVSDKVVKKYGWPMIPEKKLVVSFNNSPFIINTAVDINLEGSFESTTLPATKIRAFVVKGLTFDVLLSNPTLKTLNIRLSLRNEQQNQTINFVGSAVSKMITNHEDVGKIFPSLLRTSFEPKHQVEFQLKDDAKLIQSKPYRLSREKFSWARDKIEQLKHANYIVESKSNWASPIVIVPKDGGMDYRLCVDYRALNNETLLDPFPFPVIDDVITNLGGCQYFSKIDLKDGFHQLGLSAESRKYTAFCTPFGLYEWTRLPFGWRNSPPVFQRFMMNEVLKDLLHDNRITVYVDDIIIGARDKVECQKLTYNVLQRLHENGLTINEKKSHFIVSEVTFLGRIIDGKTRTTRQESIDKVNNMSKPKDVHSLRVFLGLTGHFQNYIPKYSSMVRPLNNLKKKDIPFEWTKECDEAFETLVKIISSNPVLNFPDWTLPFELCCDASHLGTGAILYQRDNNLPKKNQLRVIGYQSHTFTSAEINYNVTEKECLAVKLAVEYFQSYLEGRSFTVHTDHQALTSLMTLKQPKGRLSRWQVTLMPFDMIISHRKGTENQDADAISRLCLETENTAVIAALSTNFDASTKSIILKRYHDDPDSGGHDGFLRTYLKIRNRFHWKGMKDEIAQYVKSCHDCQMKKFRYRPKHDWMILAPHSTVSYETVHLDYGEIKKKSEGVAKTQSFILLVDEATRMVHTKAINEKARSLIAWLNSLTFLSSIKKIVTDNGPSFTSSEFKNWINSKNIKHYFSAPYHPEGNGLAERKMRDVKQYFSMYPKFKEGWKKCLEAATSHHNRSYNSSLGCSPLFKLTRQQSLFPADKEFGITCDTLKKMEASLSNEDIEQKRIKMKDAFNAKKGKIPDIQPGDEIIFQAGTNGKQPNIQGPVTVSDVVVKDNIPKTFIYRDTDGNRKAVALKNTLPYHTRSTTLMATIACLTFMTFITLIAPSSAQSVFARDSPVLWVKSSAPVIEKMMHVNHTLVFKTPCQIFMNATYLSASQQQDLTVWCNRRAEIVLDPLTKICSLGMLSLRRRKRFNPIVVPILFLSILGSVFVSHVFNEKTEEKFKEQQRMVSIISQENSAAHFHLRTLAADGINVTTKLNHLIRRLETFENLYPNMTIAIAQASVEFEEKHEMTKKIKRLWLQDQIPEDLFDTFEAEGSDALPDAAVLDEANPITCELDQVKGLLLLHYQIPIRRNDATIYEANPFHLQRNFTDLKTNITKTCLIKYIGPKYVLRTDKCIRALDTTENIIHRSSFIFDDGLPCYNVSEEEQQNYWKMDELSCMNAEKVTHFPAQVTTNLGGSFIYCSGKRIKIQELVFNCPNYVFRLPLEQGFSIGSHTYSNVIKILKYDSFSFVDHLRITSQVYPQMHIDPIVKDYQSIITALDKETFPKIQISIGHSHLYYFFGIIMLFLVLCIIYKYCKFRMRFLSRNERGNNPQNIPLQETVGFISQSQ